MRRITRDDVLTEMKRTNNDDTLSWARRVLEDPDGIERLNRMAEVMHGMLVSQMLASGYPRGTDCVFEAGKPPQRVYTLEEILAELQHS